MAAKKAQQVLEELKAGNKRFLEGESNQSPSTSADQTQEFCRLRPVSQGDRAVLLGLARTS